MRLDEWQRYIESEFVEGAAGQKAAERTENPSLEAERSPLSDAPDSAPVEPTALSGNAPPTEGISDTETAPIMEEPSVPRSESTDVPTLVSVHGEAVDTDTPLKNNLERNVESNQGLASEERRMPGTTPLPSHGGRPKANLPSRVLPPTSLGPSPDLTIEIPSFDRYLALRQSTAETTETALSGLPAEAEANTVPATSGARVSAAETNGASKFDSEEESKEAIDFLPTLALLQRLYRECGSSETNGSASHSARQSLLLRLTDPLLTEDEAALLLGVSTAAIQNYAGRGLRAVSADGVASTVREGGVPPPGSNYFQLSEIVRFLKAETHVMNTDAFNTDEYRK